MKVLLRRISEPAANRYTKMFPVILSTCLMLHFYTFVKKALLRPLKGLKDDSDDDSILQDPNAVVGAPADVFVHQRKLQKSWMFQTDNDPE